jgi:hypothetical protein
VYRVHYTAGDTREGYLRDSRERMRALGAETWRGVQGPTGIYLETASHWNQDDEWGYLTEIRWGSCTS